MSALRESLRIAIRALRANWFRGVLTALGIVIGVASMITVNAVSAGAAKQVTESIRRLGANVVLVDGEFINIGRGQSATERTITAADVQSIAALPRVSEVAQSQDMESLTVSAGRYRTTTYLIGITATYAGLYNQSAERGRLVSAVDVSFGRSVMVLGQVTSAKLFPGQDPIGKTVRVGSHEFEVIGVQARKGKSGGENLDSRVFVPLPVVTRVILGGANTKSVAVQVRAEADIGPVQDDISVLLRRQHNLPAAYADDFSTEDQASTVKEAQQATTTFRALTFALGGISMLVGGVGIMNMMLVSVRERTREIGIRKSVGATPRAVQAQFLIEAAVLTALAGIAGVATGLAATRSIGAVLGWQTLVSATSLAVAFLLALAVGLFFGYYPARRAARLDPITAMQTL
jgi:putative ABC transport system permease protein